MPKNTAADLAATVDRVVTWLNGVGPIPSDAEVNKGHQQYDDAEKAGITADDVRSHRRR